MSLKKLASLSFALALVYSISLPARAELLKNLKTDGSIETKSFGIDNESDFNGSADDYRSETRTRVMVGASFDLLDDVHSRVLLRKNNRLHGQNAENGNGIQTAISVENAFVKIDKVFKRVDLTIGRQFYGDSNDLNIYYGVLPDDLLNVIAVDIFRADADIAGVAKLTAIAGKTTEGTGGGVPAATNPPAANFANNDQDLFGADLSSDKVIPKGNLGLAYYTLKTKKGTAGLNGTDNNTVNSLSLKANGDILGGLGYGAQYVQNFGRNAGNNPQPAGQSDYNTGNAFILGLYWGMDMTSARGAMPIRAHGEIGRGSADFQHIAAGKRFGKIWGEHSNAGPSSLNGVGGAGLTNLKVADLGAGFTCPVTHLGLDLNWYRFIYDRAPAANGKTSAGSELDLIVSYKHSENVSFEVSAARFWVGDALQNAAPTPTSPVTRLGGDVKIKF